MCALLKRNKRDVAAKHGIGAFKVEDYPTLLPPDMLPGGKRKPKKAEDVTTSEATPLGLGEPFDWWIEIQKLASEYCPYDPARARRRAWAMHMNIVGTKPKGKFVHRPGEYANSVVRKADEKQRRAWKKTKAGQEWMERRREMANDS